MLTLLKDTLPLILGSFGLTLCLLYLLEPLSARFGLVDQPSYRKLHLKPTPMVGGVAIFVSIFLLDSLLGAWGEQYRVVMGVMGLVVLIGMADDMLDLSARFKFFAQLFAAIVVVLVGGLKVTYLGNLLGTGFLHMPSNIQSLFTVIALVGLMNAINMLDGEDGLAAGVCLVSVAGFGVLSIMINDHFHLQSVLIFLAALLAFLIRNFRFRHHQPAKVFLGDAGSMLLGFYLATLAIHITSKVTTPVNPIVAVWVVALPLMDMASVMLKRTRAGVSMMSAGRDHLHHTLRNLGYSVRRTVLIMMLLQAVFVGMALLAVLLAVPDYVMFYGFVGTFIVYHFSVAHLNRIGVGHFVYK
jgi:UDP-GlcNAc:undecaprenyl-phosphate/decaprenyl-phosphate GlcNAc-1-phosphate transferase